MKTGREGVIAGDTNMGDGGGPSTTTTTAGAAVAVAVPEEDASDDEYEQIPTGREKQRRINPPATATAQPAISQKPQHAEMNGVSGPQTSLPEKVNDSAETKPTDLGDAGLPATDDDWLRSRTNRLLDLVDPNDLEVTPVQVSFEGETRANGGPIYDKSHADESKLNDVAMGEDVAEEPAEEPAEDSLDAIRKTSRLFIRNLSYSTTEDDLRASFEQFGHLEEVSHDSITSECKGEVAM